MYCMCVRGMEQAMAKSSHVLLEVMRELQIKSRKVYNVIENVVHI